MAMKRSRKQGATGIPTAVESEIELVKAVRLVQQLASIVNNTVKRYWLSDEDRSDTLNASYSYLAGILQTCQQVTIRTLGESFTVNGLQVEYRDSVTDDFLAHLHDIHVDNFFFVSGATLDEFSKFCEILSFPPEELKQMGDFATVLERFPIKNIRTKKLIFRELAAEEVILSKQDYERMSPQERRAAGKGAGPGQDEGTGSGTGGEVAGDGGGQAAEILAFLKGNITGGDETVSRAAKEAASDPERMAQLILQAAEVREKSPDAGSAETIGDFVVACLRRTCDGLKKDPSFETTKGHKKVAHDMLLLEEAVLKRLRDLGDSEWSEDDLDKITAATEEMTDEIKIDSLTDEYLAKNNAAQAAEAQLLAAIRAEGVGPGGENSILQKLSAGGLAPSDWQELVIKSGVEHKTAWKNGGSLLSSSRILEAIGQLDSLLDTMEKEFDRMSKARRDEEAQKMIKVLEKVSSQIRQLTTQTAMAIQSLVENIRGDEAIVEDAEETLRKAGKALSLSRKDTLGSISRIIGEIFEPVELVRASLDMMQSKKFSDNPQLQGGILRLASENTDLVKTLLSHLRGISDAEVKTEA